MFAVALGAVFWGAFAANPDVRVFHYDLGPVDTFEIGTIRPLPGLDVYVVGLDDGRLRALDGIVEGTGCAVTYAPDDARATDRNPGGRPGVFLDPCGSGQWALDGDALVGDEPLRTFVVAVPPVEEGPRHVLVEVLGRERPADDPRVRD